jgi:uncharacterized membrane protein
VVWLDVLRGVAIILMVIFHFCYDLRYFSYVDWHVPNGEVWRNVRYFILSLFIFTAGFSVSLAYRLRWNAAKFFRHITMLVFSAILITGVSWILFPSSWIYFGVLHFMVVGCMVCVCFIRCPLVALIIALIIWLVFYMQWLPYRWPFHSVGDFLPLYTEDFVPVFPWLGVMLLGVSAADITRLKTHTVTNGFLVNMCSWLGKRSLLIYLLHQPILFSGFIVVARVA